MPDKQAAKAIAAAVLLLVACAYISTMYPSFKLNDSPETSTAAAGLSIMHPPGYPIYTLLGKAALLLPMANSAFRMNLLSAAISMAVLVLVLLISGKIFSSSRYNSTLGLTGILLTAASCIFWNQAIEAKGGIYMLNLAFVLAVIYIFVGLLEKFSRRAMYLMFFIYGLSLANHWQTMALLLPLLAAAAVMFGKRTGFFGMLICAAFLLAGLTPYLYLRIRVDAHSLITWGDLRVPGGFIDFITRKNYNQGEAPSAGGFMRSAAGFAALFYKNYGFLSLLVIPGVYRMYTRSRKIFFVLAAVIVPVSAAVVFLNRPPAYLTGLNDIFLMPVQAVSVYFITAGILFIFSHLKGHFRQAVFAAAIIISFAASSAMSLRYNDSSSDFLGYDYGMNVMKTMEEGSLYLAEGDYNMFPFMYLQGPGKKRGDLLFAGIADLDFVSGIDRIKHNLDTDLESTALDVNVRKLIKDFMAQKNIYRNSPSPIFDTAQATRHLQMPKGILIKVTDDDKAQWPGIFDVYSYRGIREYFRSNPEAYLPISWYFWSMFNQAGSLSAHGMHVSAVRLYKKALLFPGEVPRNDIYYNISKDYREINDSKNELKSLLDVVKTDPLYYNAYGRLGWMLYLNGDAAAARDYAVKAKELGLKDSDSLKLVGLLEKGGIN
jgi:tetratricopeptide (TPR) repeat protein